MHDNLNLQKVIDEYKHAEKIAITESSKKRHQQIRIWLEELIERRKLS